MAIAGPRLPVPVEAARRPDGRSQEGRFAKFYTRYFPVVRRTLAALTDDTRAVDDATQDAFLSARNRWEVVGDYDKPEAWVIKVALRRMRRYQQARPELPTDAVESPVTADHADRVANEDELFAAIRKLPPRRAEILVLHDLLGYPSGEIADMLRIRSSTVRSHLSLAREDLRRLLNLPGGGAA